MGFLVIWMGIYFPMIISLIDPDISISVGGTNLGVIFILSSPMIGYYIGEMIRSEEGEDQDNTRSTGFALFGMFLGFLSIIGVNLYDRNDQFNSLVAIGIFGFGVALITFLANFTDFIKNRQFSEEKFKNVVSSVGVIGFYQYLITSILTPIIESATTNTFFYLLIVLIFAVILGFIFLRELRNLLPEFIIDYIKAFFNSLISDVEK